MARLGVDGDAPKAGIKKSHMCRHAEDVSQTSWQSCETSRLSKYVAEVMQQAWDSEYVGSGENGYRNRYYSHRKVNDINRSTDTD